VDDGGVSDHMGGRGHLADETSEVLPAADRRKLLATPQLRADGDHVHRIAALVHGSDGREYAPMRLPVEVLLLHDAHGTTYRALLHEHRAEGRLLRLKVLRRQPIGHPVL
jgi:hypothetical protein